MVACYNRYMTATVGTLERGLKILDMLVEIESDPVRGPRGLSVQQAAVVLGIHKSSASRLIQTLVANGWAEPVSSSGRGVRLGPAVQSTTSLKEEQRRLRQYSRPYLERLVEQTGECAHAAVSTGSAALVIDDVETDQQLRVVAGRGRRVPLHCTSAGKVLVAVGLAPVPDELSPRTAFTLTDQQAFSSEIEQILRVGYSVDNEENDLGVRCISAPVFAGLGGAPVGCIGIDGPSVRVAGPRIDEMAVAIISAAHELSVQLGSNSGSSTDLNLDIA